MVRISAVVISSSAAKSLCVHMALVLASQFSTAAFSSATCPLTACAGAGEQAEVQAQLELVRASRARIVEAGDAQRRRLEPHLHDGAQQRLVTLTLALGMARGRVAGVDPELEALIEAA